MSPIDFPKVRIVNQTPQSPYIITLFVVMTAIASFVVPIKNHLPNTFSFVKGSTYLPWSLLISERTFGNTNGANYSGLEFCYSAKVAFLDIELVGYIDERDGTRVELDVEGVYF